MKLSLQQPIQAHGEEVRELTLRAPLARDLRGIIRIGAPPDIGDLLNLVARLADVPPSSIDQMSAADAFAAMELIAPFLLPPPAT